MEGLEVVEDSEVVEVVEDMEVEVAVEDMEVEVAVDLEGDLRITGRMILGRARVT